MMMSQAKNVGVLTSQQEGIMVGFLGLLNEHALPVFSVCVCVFSPRFLPLLKTCTIRFIIHS